ncbi:MAG: aromatic ring-hydroxylating dioxygenase subunit alpha [Actinomycetota bacterium]
MSAVPEHIGEQAAPEETAETWQPVPTLGGGEYHLPEVWVQEQQRVFGAEWICVGREEEFPERGDYITRDVGTESVIVVRANDGTLRCFYNVCAHRGTRLCDGEGHADSGVIKCPYHAWTYDTEGTLVGTPNIPSSEGFDRSSRPLWRAAVAAWNGFVFVNLATEPETFGSFLDRNCEGNPTAFLANWQLADLRIGYRIDYEVQANWKVIVDNYNECLHCPSVHPELVALVPTFRSGMTEGDEGAALAEGATTLTASGTSNRPPLPGLAPEQRAIYAGNMLYPTLMINVQSDCAMTYRLEPLGPDRSRIVSEYLFHPDTIARSEFDPADVVAMWDLISRQDWAVCERAQKGMHSRAYADGGVYPFNDRWIAAFNDRYRLSMG